ncbi:MAG: 4-hydroxyphenylpyruvate dioxygenase [Proteobacteria bacterium]|nr:4-hydroxyphenylpyruvate dioxygenase [Pseudomonadota bacterium]
MSNPIGIRGISFIEFSSDNPSRLDELFLAFGFSRVGQHKDYELDHYRQGDIHFFINREATGFTADFREQHGPSASAMGWVVENPAEAKRIAVQRGARSFDGDTHFGLPAIYGIGDSLIFFVPKDSKSWFEDSFVSHKNPFHQKGLGFRYIDHLTNNVYKGTMERWSNFYKQLFGFTEVKYFDINGVKTGLQSYALRSPCGTFCIPINESKDGKSQIQEYLDDYNGPGIQHIALLSDDLLTSLEQLPRDKIETLDIDDGYYEEVFERVPNVTEDPERIKANQVLVDGDEEGYLLQIFTKNLIGPIFIEMIQRKNHHAFGEGNFGALFRSIEREQQKRGYL